MLHGAAPAVCPFGYRWTLLHPVEEVAPAEMQRRFPEMTKGVSDPSSPRDSAGEVPPKAGLGALPFYRHGRDDP